MSHLESPSRQKRRASVVVRIWREDGTLSSSGRTARNASDGVRGSVQVVGRDSVRYFASLEDMAGIIGEVVGVERPNSVHDSAP